MKAIGIIEISSIAQGVLLCDGMLKAAEVQILDALPMCPGKYVIIIGGDVASVRHSVETAREEVNDQLIGHLVIANLDPKVLEAVWSTPDYEPLAAVGIIETYSVASGVMAADAAVKAATVRLVEIRLSRGLGGKSFIVLTGTVGDVKAAVQAGADVVKNEGMLVGTSVIPSPHPNLKQILG